MAPGKGHPADEQLPKAFLDACDKIVSNPPFKQPTSLWSKISSPLMQAFKKHRHDRADGKLVADLKSAHEANKKSSKHGTRAVAQTSKGPSSTASSSRPRPTIKQIWDMDCVDADRLVSSDGQPVARLTLEEFSRPDAHGISLQALKRMTSSRSPTKSCITTQGRRLSSA